MNDTRATGESGCPSYVRVVIRLTGAGDGVLGADGGPLRTDLCGVGRARPGDRAAGQPYGARGAGGRSGPARRLARGVRALRRARVRPALEPAADLAVYRSVRLTVTSMLSSPRSCSSSIAVTVTSSPRLRATTS